jgi:RNA polymerase sigma factor (sigma-70 family)
LFTTYVAWWRRRWNAELPSAAVPEPGTDDGAGRVAQRHDLVRALAELPRGQRAVVVLRYFEDLTESETADMLQCSVGTVKSQSSRALAALRSSRHLTAREDEAP